MIQRTSSFDSDRNWEDRFPHASGSTRESYNRGSNDYTSAYERGYYHGYEDASNETHGYNNDEFYNDNDYDYVDYNYVSNDYDGDDDHNDMDSNQMGYRESNYDRLGSSHRGGVYFDKPYGRSRNSSDSRRDINPGRQHWSSAPRRNTGYEGQAPSTGRRTGSTQDNRGWGNKSLSEERDRSDSFKKGFPALSKTERTGIARTGGTASPRARRGFGSSNR